MTNMLTKLPMGRNQAPSPLDPRIEDRAAIEAVLAIGDLREVIARMGDLPAHVRAATVRESQAIEQHLADGTLLSAAFEAACTDYADALMAVGPSADINAIIERLDNLVMVRLDIRDLFAAHRAVAAIAADPTTGIHWGAIG